MDRCGKKLITRTLAITLSVPLFMIVVVGFSGTTIKDALYSSYLTLFGFPYTFFTWLLLIIMNVVILIHMKPIISFWKKYNNKKDITLEEKNCAMTALNTIDRVIILLCSIGFIIGTSLSVFIGEGVVFKAVSASYVVAESSVVGIFSAVIMNMSLNNVFFPIKRALMIYPPTVKPKYNSFYTQLFKAIMLLFAFFGFQILTIAIDLYSMAVVKAQELANMNSDMQNFYLPEFFFSHAGRTHKATKDLMDLFALKIFIFLLLSIRTMSLIKMAIKNPLKTVEDRLEALSSQGQKSQTPIAIVNNDEFSTIYNDINKLIEAKQSEIDLSQQRLHKVIDSAADPIISFDSSGRIYIFNPAAESFFHWKREDVQGANLINLFDPDENICRDCHGDGVKFVEIITSEKNRLQRFQGITALNERVSFEANFSRVVTPDGVIFTAIIRDISKQMEFEESLKNAKVSAEKANKLKSEFLANMSHELRTPLNAVLGFTQLLIDDKNLTSEQQDKIGIISRSGEHLLALINDILDISKIEAGKIELHSSTFSLKAFIEDLRQMLDLKCKKKGLALYVEYVEPIPDYVYCDLGKLRQILINIIGNAIKFTDDGGISLVVGLENEQLKFSVNDTGKGIPKEDLDSIIKPFTQSSLIDNEGGTGLGLAITNSFINMMGGKLNIESEVGRGSKFSFPINIEVKDELADSNDSQGTIIGIIGDRHPNVLIVDDKLNNRLILKEMLERVGFSVMEAQNGKVALDRAREYRPELIFMDIKMPVMDGYDSVREMKKDPNIKNIPTFALTASAFKHDEKSILGAGFNGFLAKPFKKSSLFHLIQECSDIKFDYENQTKEVKEISLNSLNYKDLYNSIGKELFNAIDDMALINDFTGIKKLLEPYRLEEKLKDFIELVFMLTDNFDDEKLEELLERIKGRE